MLQKQWEALINTPLHVNPSIEHEFILDADASVDGVGEVLFHSQRGNECVFVYFSRMFSCAEINYCVMQLEVAGCPAGEQALQALPVWQVI